MDIWAIARRERIGAAAGVALLAFACGSGDSIGTSAAAGAGGTGAGGNGQADAREDPGADTGGDDRSDTGEAGGGEAGEGAVSDSGGDEESDSGGDEEASTFHDTNIGNCTIFPADNAWNRDVSDDPVDPNSDNYIAYINANGGTNLYPDFGSNQDQGIPYVAVPGTQPKVDVAFDNADESDPGPYPIPDGAPIEGSSAASGNRHVLVIDRDACLLYETYDSRYVGPGWQCGAGAEWDLTSDALRPDGFRSADAAGLPIFAGLVRHDEAVTAGVIKHALRFTVEETQRAFVHPATHFASSSTDPNAPPMGMRVRLKASYDISTFTGASQVIAAALKTYGMFLADTGSNWYISGASDPNFDDDELGQLKSVPGTAFEVVQLGPLVTN